MHGKGGSGTRSGRARRDACRRHHSSRKARTRQNQERQALDAALAVEREARNNQRDAQDAYNAVKNEQSALAKITQRGSGSAAQNNLLSAGDVSAAPGFEKALAAFMGPTATAALNKSLGSEAPAVWTSIGQDEPHADLTWPETVLPLAEQVEGPAALTRAFYSCGVADSIDAANRLQPQLSFGQILTSRDGGIWRWDGYAALPGAEERAAAERMAQVKRLEALDTQVTAANDASRPLKLLSKKRDAQAVSGTGQQPCGTRLGHGTTSRA